VVVRKVSYLSLETMVVAIMTAFSINDPIDYSFS